MQCCCHFCAAVLEHLSTYPLSISCPAVLEEVDGRGCERRGGYLPLFRVVWLLLRRGSGLLVVGGSGLLVGGSGLLVVGCWWGACYNFGSEVSVEQKFTMPGQWAAGGRLIFLIPFYFLFSFSSVVFLQVRTIPGSRSQGPWKSEDSAAIGAACLALRIYRGLCMTYRFACFRSPRQWSNHLALNYPTISRWVSSKRC
jgi:hypothetical protein